jgi:hypothetical protein
MRNAIASNGRLKKVFEEPFPLQMLFPYFSLLRL